MNATRRRSWLGAIDNPRACNIHDQCNARLTEEYFKHALTTR